MCCTFFPKNLQCCAIRSFSDSQKETETISNPMQGNLCTLSTEHPKVTFQGCRTPSPWDTTCSLQITQEGPNIPPGETENSIGVNKVMLVLIGNLH